MHQALALRASKFYTPFMPCSAKGMKRSAKKTREIAQTMSNKLNKGISVDKVIKRPVDTHYIDNVARVSRVKERKVGHLATHVSSASTDSLKNLQGQKRILTQTEWDLAHHSQHQNGPKIINEFGKKENLIKNLKKFQKEMGPKMDKLLHLIDSELAAPCAIMFQLTSSAQVNPDGENSVVITPLIPTLFHEAEDTYRVQKSYAFIKLVKLNNPAVRLASEETIKQVLSNSGIRTPDARAGFVLKSIVFALNEWRSNSNVLIQGLDLGMTKESAKRIESLDEKHLYDLLYSTTVVGPIKPATGAALQDMSDLLRDGIKSCSTKLNDPEIESDPISEVDINFIETFEKTSHTLSLLAEGVKEIRNSGFIFDITQPADQFLSYYRTTVAKLPASSPYKLGLQALLESVSESAGLVTENIISDKLDSGSAESDDTLDKGV